MVFEERGNRSTQRKPLGAEKRSNKLNPHMTPDLGIEPGPHWWEASALTAALSLHRHPRLIKMLLTLPLHGLHPKIQCLLQNLFKLLWPISRKARNFSAHLR